MPPVPITANTYHFKLSDSFWREKWVRTWNKSPFCLFRSLSMFIVTGNCFSRVPPKVTVKEIFLRHHKSFKTIGSAVCAFRQLFPFARGLIASYGVEKLRDWVCFVSTNKKAFIKFVLQMEKFSKLFMQSLKTWTKLNQSCSPASYTVPSNFLSF